nr:lysosomal amino acid transporter 1 homolog [Ipomoea batatas]
MPGERSLRLRLCLATTPLPSTATSFPVSVFTLNPPQSPVMSPLRLHPSPPSSCRLAQVLSFPTPMETDKNCSFAETGPLFFQLPMQTYMVVFFTLTTFVLAGKALYYSHIYPKLKSNRSSSPGCWLLRSTNEVRTADADLRRSDQLRCRVPTPTSTSIAPPPDHRDQPAPPPRPAGCRPPRSTDHCDTAPPLTTVFWTSGSDLVVNL